jgi:hypothetical protein
MGTVVDDIALTGLFKEFQMFSDFSVLPFDFNDTTVTVVANSMKAKLRFDGAVSVEVRKSAVEQFLEKLDAEGYTMTLDDPEYDAYMEEQNAAYEESVLASYRAKGYSNIY